MKYKKSADQKRKEYLNKIRKRRGLKYMERINIKKRLELKKLLDYKPNSKLYESILNQYI